MGITFSKQCCNYLEGCHNFTGDPLRNARQRNPSSISVISTSEDVWDWPNTYLSFSLQSEDEQMIHCAPDALQTRGIKSTKEFELQSRLFLSLRCQRAWNSQCRRQSKRDRYGLISQINTTLGLCNARLLKSFVHTKTPHTQVNLPTPLLFICRLPETAKTNYYAIKASQTVRLTFIGASLAPSLLWHCIL